MEPGNDSLESPGFFTLRFHAEFLPRVLARRWEFSRRPPPTSPFQGHVPIELTVAPMACLGLVGWGLGVLLDRHLAWGWVPFGLGVAGIAALLWMAVQGSWSEPAGYEGFSASVFLFLVLLGASAGVFYGVIDRPRSWAMPEQDNTGVWLGTAVGAALGYPLGIFGGLYNQKLGFLAFLPVLASRAGMIGLVVTDLVLLFGH